jgi:hypothetical protein
VPGKAVPEEMTGDGMATDQEAEIGRELGRDRNEALLFSLWGL